MQKNRTKLCVCILYKQYEAYDYKFFLRVVAFFRLLQKLLSLMQLCIHQLLLQVFVFYHFVYVLTEWPEKEKCLLEIL